MQAHNTETISYLGTEPQKKKIEEYNSAKKPQEQIPLVERNPNTGWPLIQVTLYSRIEDSEEPLYEPVLGIRGGPCHVFYIGAFSLACALAKLPGTFDCKKDENAKVADKKFFNLNNIQMFLSSFSLSHKQSGISITQSAGFESKQLTIKIDNNESQLTNAFYKIFRMAIKNGVSLNDIALPFEEHERFPVESRSRYTADRIRSGVNTDIATYHDGQIFVDLGKFLEVEDKDNNYKIDQATRELLAALFKVHEFQNLLKASPEMLQSNQDQVGTQSANTLAVKEPPSSKVLEALFGKTPGVNFNEKSEADKQFIRELIEKLGSDIINNPTSENNIVTKTYASRKNRDFRKLLDSNPAMAKQFLMHQNAVAKQENVRAPDGEPINFETSKRLGKYYKVVQTEGLTNPSTRVSEVSDMWNRDKSGEKEGGEQRKKAPTKSPSHGRQ